MVTSKMWKKTPIFLIAAVAVASLTGCGGRSSNVIAVVNGQSITQDQFYNYLEAKPEVQIITQDGQTATARVQGTLAFQALQDLVRQQIIVQLAKDNGVSPTPQEIDAEVEFQRKREPEFVTQLKDRGLTLDQIKESLEVDLSREKLLTKDIKVEDSEVETYIKNNREMFTVPATFDAKWIFVQAEAKRREVDRELNSGSSFSTVARRLSDDPNAKDTLGQFPNRVVAGLPAQIQEVVNKTQEGKETDWIQLSDGWAKFYIEKKAAEKYNEPNDTEKTWLKRQLAVRKGLQSKDLDRRLLDKLKASKINIVYRELQNPWETAFKEIEKMSDTKTNTAEDKKPEGN